MACWRSSWRGAGARSAFASAAWFTASYVQAQLVGVKAADWLVFVASIAMLLAAALAGSFAPAWRASRLSPVRALRAD